jgi:hypothetical protein
MSAASGHSGRGGEAISLATPSELRVMLAQSTYSEGAVFVIRVQVAERPVSSA